MHINSKTERNPDHGRGGGITTVKKTRWKSFLNYIFFFVLCVIYNQQHFFNNRSRPHIISFSVSNFALWITKCFCYSIITNYSFSKGNFDVLPLTKKLTKRAVSSTWTRKILKNGTYAIRRKMIKCLFFQFDIWIENF